MNIVKILVPDAYKLKKQKDGTLTSVIVDEEIDAFNVKFIGDECIEIDTDEMAYITLSINNLYKIIDLIEAAEYKYSKQRKK